uniref:Uncharacterized protein n=1 Tax=Timema tahoe TaxID=61484 RepID=A0A7R9IKT4_9NEOP|nr:unnamed protein product [Timema tahoe]
MFPRGGADKGAVDGPGCGSMGDPTCGFVEGPGWELVSTGSGSSGSSALAAAGSTRTAASSSTAQSNRMKRSLSPLPAKIPIHLRLGLPSTILKSSESREVNKVRRRRNKSKLKRNVILSGKSVIRFKRNSDPCTVHNNIQATEFLFRQLNSSLDVGFRDYVGWCKQNFVPEPLSNFRTI